MPNQATAFNDYLNQDCLALLSTETLPIADRAIQLSRRLTQYDSALAHWSSASQPKAELQQTLLSFINFKNKREENSQKIFGQLDIETFVSKNRDVIEQLLLCAPKEIQQDWDERQEKLLLPDFGQTIKNMSLSLAATLSTPFTMIFRRVAPKALKETISKYTPTTFRQECQIKLGELIDAGINALTRELAQIETEQLSALDPLSDSEEARKKLNRLLNDSSPETLSLIQTQVSATRTLLDDYQAIQQKVCAQQNMISMIQAFDQQAQTFIARHDGFLVRLSNFFAKLFSFFKSDTARKVDQIKLMKEEVSSIKQAYETEICANLKSIQDHPNTPQNIKAHLIEPLAQKNNLAPEPVNAQMNVNKALFFNQITESRQQIKPPEALSLSSQSL